VLSNIGRKLGAVELGNIFYLIDVEWASITSKALTDQIYYMGNWGPYNPYLRRVIEQMDGYEVKVTKRGSGKRGKSKLIHEVGSKPRFKPKLDEEEIGVIQKVFKNIDGLSSTAIKQLVYQTEPVEVYLINRENEFRFGDALDLSLVCRMDDFVISVVNESVKPNQSKQRSPSKKKSKTEALGNSDKLLGVNSKNTSLYLILFIIIACCIVCLWLYSSY